MSGILIWGTVDPKLTGRRGFFARLSGRGQEPRVVDLGRDRRLIDLATDGVQPLVPEFKKYILRRIGQPWPATQAILKYLDIATTVNLRGESEGDAPPILYVQLTFRERAGMTTISSAVAAHWASGWFGEERERITSILGRGGFTPTRASEPEGELTFLPMGDLGYAAFRAAAQDDAEEDESGPFRLDAAITEDDAQAEQLLRGLTEKWTSFMADGRCHCQFCDPGFDQARLRADLQETR